MRSTAFGMMISVLLGTCASPAANSQPAPSASPSPSPAPAASPSTSSAPAPAAVTKPALTLEQAYQEFLVDMVSPQNLADLIEQIDRVIDEADNADGSSNQPNNSGHADTRNGFHLEFSVIHTPEAILYYAGVSRKDFEMLKYRDATMVLALFCNRVGLTHPIQISEGEKPIFHAQWLINPKEWKPMRKKMLEVRAANRAEKNLYTAMRNAVTEEVNARVSTNLSNSSRSK